MNYLRVPRLDLHATNNHVSCIIYSTTIKPLPMWKTDCVPQMLMQMRWDGSFQFPTTRMKPGESAYDAVKRCLKNTMNITVINQELFIPLISLSDKEGSGYWHTFRFLVPSDYYLWMMRHVVKDTKHYLQDIQGYIAVPAAKTTVLGQEQGILTFLKNQFYGPAKTQLESIIKHHRWVDLTSKHYPPVAAPHGAVWAQYTGHEDLTNHYVLLRNRTVDYIVATEDPHRKFGRNGKWFSVDTTMYWHNDGTNGDEWDQYDIIMYAKKH